MSSNVLENKIYSDSRTKHYEEKNECPICETPMINIQPCHKKCFKCGAEETCEDL